MEQNAVSAQPDDKPPAEYVCSITGQVMVNPVITSDGFSYENNAILAWFETGGYTSPRTGEKLKSRTLRPNNDLRTLIQGSKYKPEGPEPTYDHVTKRPKVEYFDAADDATVSVSSHSSEDETYKTGDSQEGEEEEEVIDVISDDSQEGEEEEEVVVIVSNGSKRARREEEEEEEDSDDEEEDSDEECIISSSEEDEDPKVVVNRMAKKYFRFPRGYRGRGGYAASSSNRRLSVGNVSIRESASSTNRRRSVSNVSNRGSASSSNAGRRFQQR